MSQITLLFVYHAIDLIPIFFSHFCLLLKIPEIMAQITSEKWAKNIGQQGKRVENDELGTVFQHFGRRLWYDQEKFFAAGGRDKGTAELYQKRHSHAYAVYCC